MKNSVQPSERAFWSVSHLCKLFPASNDNQSNHLFIAIFYPTHLSANVWKLWLLPSDWSRVLHISYHGSLRFSLQHIIAWNLMFLKFIRHSSRKASASTPDLNVEFSQHSVLPLLPLITMEALSAERLRLTDSLISFTSPTMSVTGLEGHLRNEKFQLLIKLDSRSWSTFLAEESFDDSSKENAEAGIIILIYLRRSSIVLDVHKHARERTKLAPCRECWLVIPC